MGPKKILRIEILRAFLFFLFLSIIIGITFKLSIIKIAIHTIIPTVAYYLIEKFNLGRFSQKRIKSPIGTIGFIGVCLIFVAIISFITTALSPYKPQYPFVLITIELCFFILGIILIFIGYIHRKH